MLWLARMSGYGAIRRNGPGGACLLCPGIQINLFRYGKGIIDLYAKVPDGAFDRCVLEEKLHGAQIAGPPVDQGCLGSS
jgi:hypothetical protein